MFTLHSTHSHILVLRRFLEECLNQDLRNFFDNQCFWTALTHSDAPESCKKQYLQGQGLPSYTALEGVLTREQYFGEEESVREKMRMGLPGDDMQGGREWSMGMENVF